MSVAYQNLSLKREEITSRLSSLGFDVPTTDTPVSNAKTKSMRRYLLISLAFLIPTLLIAGTALVVHKVNNTITHIQLTLKNRVTSVLSNPQGLSASLEKVATVLENITPERKEELAMNMKRIADAIKPLSDQVKPLYLADKDLEK